MNDVSFQMYEETVRTVQPLTYGGVVRDVVGLLIESSGPKVKMGEMCYLLPDSGVPVLSE